ncbi:IS607 family element transposase accessory protein TnpB [Hoyosella rhizosphaerae]|uniref:Resolvase n=1 Tax=Hoyosella rhizosphaerae TaxID=1755582 RepID=A0A916UCA3_9ACTN|nr:IS607 family element RNA-guided endonuclease TnpB [Hoyosella rhizosphaerae]MBN4925872.1 IS607 family element transposase accessory protein TnpB [Hoyosella rhizosphaerae]GGC67304.1 resolvase [Hoyosella rhizosphaerae]
MAEKFEVPGGWVLQAYQYALDPTDAQAVTLESHAGGARFAWNTMLRAVKANLSQREAEKSYGITDADLTPSMVWSFQSLRNDFNKRKHQVAVREDGTPWWAENSKEAYANACKNLAEALKNWSDSRKGTRKGPRVGFPSFKSKRSTRAFAFTTGTIRVEPDRHHVTLPRLGTLRVHESTRKLARRLEHRAARILKATVRFERGRWLVSFTCVVERAASRPAHVKRLAPVVGVDVGVKDLIVAATPDGREVLRVQAPKEFTHASRKLRALQRKAARQHGPWNAATQTKQEPSNAWTRTQAAIAKQHVRVANLRRDRLHKLTTLLAQSFDVIGTETLAVKNMMAAGGARKKGLNRSIADAGLGEFSRQLDYKTTWYSSALVKADRWYPSSKTCSGCGSVKAKLSLSDRLYVCDNEDCGLNITGIDRDLNAAINLARYARAEQSACFDNGGADRKTTASVALVAMKPESNNGSASPKSEAA